MLSTESELAVGSHQQTRYLAGHVERNQFGLHAVPHEEMFNTGYRADGYDPQPQSDISGRPFEIKMELINNALRGSTRAVIQHIECESAGLPSPLAQTAEHAASLVAQNEDFKAYVESQVQERQDVFNAIVKRYEDADTRAHQYADENNLSVEDRMKRRAVERVATASQLWVVSDYDGSATETENARVDYLEKFSPGSVHLEELLDIYGRDDFPFFYAATVRHALKHFPDIYEEGGENVTLRRGFTEFAQWAIDNGVPVTILTANWEAFVRGGLKRHSLDDKIDIRGISPDDARSTEKGAYMKRLAIKYPDYAFPYIGDGSSDEDAANAMPVIPFYLALKGGKFAKILKEREACFLEYENFDDIMRIGQEIVADTQQIRDHQATYQQ